MEVENGPLEDRFPFSSVLFFQLLGQTPQTPPLACATKETHDYSCFG